MKVIVGRVEHQAVLTADGQQGKAVAGRVRLQDVRRHRKARVVAGDLWPRRIFRRYGKLTFQGVEPRRLLLQQGPLFPNGASRLVELLTQDHEFGLRHRVRRRCSHRLSGLSIRIAGGHRLDQQANGKDGPTKG